MKKIIFIIMDGAADKEKSALALAKKPYLDMLAANGFCGIWTGPAAPKDYNVKSLSEIANLELLGYSWSESPGRGFLEALGIGLKPTKNAIYFRANFATVDKAWNILDRRAGRDESGLKELSKKLSMSINGVKIKFYKGVGHRGVLELSGFSPAVSDSDIGRKKPQKIVALGKDAKAVKTADVLNAFLKRSQDILSSDPINKKRRNPANFILIRGPGSYKRAESFKERYGMRACSVSNSGIIQGISRYLGIDVIPAGGYSDIEEDLSEKTDIAINALERYDFVLMHINGADVFSHDKNFKGKIKFIEKIDNEVFSKIIKLRHIKIAVISDHKTSSATGEHSFGPVPFLIYSGEDVDGIEKFDEKGCRGGFVAANPMHKILQEV